jgi:transcriptional regulator with GAF, ATPase, and Fis domain
MTVLHYTDTRNNSSNHVVIKKPLFSIGRQKPCDLQLNDSSVDAIHMNLLKKGNLFQFTVLSRQGPVLLNGTSVKSGKFKVGDLIKLGPYLLRLEEGVPKKPVAAQKTDTREILNLENLVDFSTNLMKDISPERLFRQLLVSVVDLTKAEKGFVIVFHDDERTLAAQHNIDKKGNEAALSDTIIDRVIKTQEALIVSDALHDKDFRGAKSVVDLQLSSVMCVPLKYRGDMLGVIYLGNDSISGLFTEIDLSLLQLWAMQASMLLHTALMLNELQLSNKELREQLELSNDTGFVGSGEKMQNVKRLIKRLSPTDVSILLLGETGTGKEVAAQEIHNQSDRNNGVFISINCGAIPENLLESELFGHKKGSFTGAVSDKIGKFEAANGGSIFLDEIGEMPMNLQVKLLRVIQERKIERIGDLKPRELDIRIISATNKDLQHEIAEGRFREDLLYRLNEFVIQLPPLRDRGQDIVELAKYFFQVYKNQYQSKIKGFHKDTLNAMLNYYWPGNIRQLKSRIKRAVILSETSLLTPQDLDFKQEDIVEIKDLDVATEEFKLDYVAKALERNNWNKSQTGRELGVDPRTIFRYVEKLKAD